MLRDADITLLPLPPTRLLRCYIYYAAAAAMIAATPLFSLPPLIQPPRLYTPLRYTMPLRRHDIYAFISCQLHDIAAVDYCLRC